MKGYVILILLFALIGCSNGDDKNQEALPTVFEGALLYEDTLDPVPFAQLNISARKITSASSDAYVETKTVFLKELDKGMFNIVFEANDEIDYFDIFVIDFPDETYIDEPGGSPSFTIEFIQCQPTECDNFESGNEYSDITILIPSRE